jgi:polyhydroxyalkanoate synthesis repressor PhaR
MSSDKPRVIRKYSNRRLYDTEQSRYITLDELKNMILAGTPFSVLTAKGEDITSSALLSVLLGSEVMGRPVFSEQNLRSMVMFMHGPMRGPARVFFEQCMPLFLQAQASLTEKLGGNINERDLENLALLQGNFVRQVMEQYVCRGLENYLATQKNMERMMAAQTMPFQNIFNMMSGGGAPPPESPPEDKK